MVVANASAFHNAACLLRQAKAAATGLIFSVLSSSKQTTLYDYAKINIPPFESSSFL
jgi:hypothetical protein